MAAARTGHLEADAAEVLREHDVGRVDRVGAGGERHVLEAVGRADGIHLGAEDPPVGKRLGHRLVLTRNRPVPPSRRHSLPGASSGPYWWRTDRSAHDYQPRGADHGQEQGEGTSEPTTSRPETAPAARPKLKNKVYLAELDRLQLELSKLQEWVKARGLKVVVIFEGRDAAGKGGSIKTITMGLNPRIARVVALPAPTERERTQWYFQRYVQHLPAAGEIVLLDRSWYNRAGVERVMGFATQEEVEEFYRSCPEFERMLVRSGIILVKYWFSVSDAEQERRFQARISDPTKRWKLSPMDLQSRTRWVEYSMAKDEMFRHTDIKQAPWYVVGGRRQEAGPAQRDQPPALADPVRGPDAGAHLAAAARAGPRLRPPADGRADVHPGAVLSQAGPAGGRAAPSALGRRRSRPSGAARSVARPRPGGTTAPASGSRSCSRTRLTDSP